MSLIQKSQNGRQVLVQGKTTEMRADIGKGNTQVAKPGDTIIQLNTEDETPSDLLIVMDNSDSLVPRIFVLGGLIPNHLRDFPNPNNYDITGEWENPDGFINGNDELKGLYLRGRGLKVSAIEREVETDASQFKRPITVMEGEYNRVRATKITTELYKRSNMTVNPLVNNIVLKDSLLDLVENRTYLFEVAPGEILSQVLRVQVGINWTVKVQS